MLQLYKTDVFKLVEKGIKCKNKSLTKTLCFVFFLCVENNELIITYILKYNLQ